MSKRAALVKGGVVENTCLFDDSFAGATWGDCTVVLSATAGPGDLYDGRTFTRGAPVTVRTRVQELAQKGTLSGAEIQEALKLVLGWLPPDASAAVEEVPLRSGPRRAGIPLSTWVLPGLRRWWG